MGMTPERRARRTRALIRSSSNLPSAPASACAHWPSRVVLASVSVDAIEPALDVVLAHAAVVVIAQQDALAGVDHDIPSLVELRRPAQVRESPPTQRTRQSSETALSRALGEGDLGYGIVGAAQVGFAPQDHAFFAFAHRARAALRARVWRSSAVIAAKRALPPFRPPLRPSATACGFFALATGGL